MSQKMQKVKQPFVAVNPYTILRIDEIPTCVTFNKLLCAVYPYSRRICGIMRTADYSVKTRGKTIYFVCTSTTDAEFIAKQQIVFPGSKQQPNLTRIPRIVDSVIGSSSLLDRVESIRYNGVPATIRIYGMERCYDNSYNMFNEFGYTDVLAEVAHYFEQKGSVTGVRLGYDPVRKGTRLDAFITFLSAADAMDMTRDGPEDVHPKRHHIIYNTVDASMSPNVPVLTRAGDAELLQRGRAPWSREIERINQLIVPNNYGELYHQNQLAVPGTSYLAPEPSCSTAARTFTTEYSEMVLEVNFKPPSRQTVERRGDTKAPPDNKAKKGMLDSLSCWLVKYEHRKQQAIRMGEPSTSAAAFNSSSSTAEQPQQKSLKSKQRDITRTVSSSSKSSDSSSESQRKGQSKPIAIPRKPRKPANLDKLSTEAVWDLKGATTGQFDLVYDSDIEEPIEKKRKSVEEVDSDEDRLVIDEDVNFDFD